MWESTIGTDLDLFPVLFQIMIISRTLKRIQRAVTKQTIQFLNSLMARIILACPVFKIAVGIIHFLFCSFPISVPISALLHKIYNKIRAGRIIQVRESDKM